MTITSGVTEEDLGADAVSPRPRASMTETGGALSTARRRWMEAESAYRTAAIREGTVDTLHQLRQLAKLAESAYCEALGAADPVARSVEDAPVSAPR